jgi:uncharacterized protein YukE
MNQEQIQHQIKRIKRQLNELGSMHPGSLGVQFNVCGTPRCRCKDPKDPRRHGPYYQLSYTWRGKSSTRFVRLERVTEMREKVSNYKRFRELVNEWVDLSMDLERIERATKREHGGRVEKLHFR